MADESKLRVTLNLPQNQALSLVQYALQEFNLDFGKDIQIEALDNLADTYADKLAFISYRRDDSIDICGRVYDYLLQTFSKNSIFRDFESIPAGLDFSQEIIRNAQACHVMIVIIGPTWLEILQRRFTDATEIDYVRLEIETALERDIPIVPVYVNNAAYLSNEDLPTKLLQSLEMRNAVTIRPDPHFRSDVKDLVRKLQELFDLQ